MQADCVSTLSQKASNQFKSIFKVSHKKNKDSSEAEYTNIVLDDLLKNQPEKSSFTITCQQTQTLRQNQTKFVSNTLKVRQEDVSQSVLDSEQRVKRFGLTSVVSTTMS